MRTSVCSIEEVERFWDARPCNVRHSSAAVGSERWSREVTVRKYFVEPHILGFAQFERWRGKSVLEIGCGIGTDTLEFLRFGALVDAMDVSFGSLTLARSRCEELAGRGVMFFNMNAEEEMPAAGGPGYDLIYSFGVLHHTPEPRRILVKAYDRLSRDGELRIMLYAKWSIKNLFGQQPEAQAGCPLARTYTARSARKLLESCGFEAVSVRKAHIFPYRVEDYVQYRYVKPCYYRWMPRRIFSMLERLLGWHLLIVAKQKLESV